jgi:hypothetical protein
MECRSHVIALFGVLTSRRVRQTRAPSWRPEIADNRHEAKLPENPPISHYQGNMASESMVRQRGRA